MKELAPVKTIVSMRVARELLALGFRIKDIEYSRRVPGKVVYVFRNDVKIEEHLSNIRRR